LSALEQELQGKITQLVNEVGELKSEKDLREEEFTERVETLDSHVKSLEHTIHILMTEKDDMEQQLRCIKAEGADFATKLSELEVERDNLSQKLEVVSTLNVNLDTEKKTFASELGSLKEQLQLLEEEKETLRNLHELSFQLVKDSLPVSFQSHVLGSTEVQEDLSSALGLFQQHLRDVSGERDQLVCRIDAVEEHMKEVENEKEQLNHKVFDLEERFMKATADGLEAAKQLESWKLEVVSHSLHTFLFIDVLFDTTMFFSTLKGVEL
jgi:chromosome segregation ATPase